MNVSAGSKRSKALELKSEAAGVSGDKGSGKLPSVEENDVGRIENHCCIIGSHQLRTLDFMSKLAVLHTIPLFKKCYNSGSCTYQSHGKRRPSITRATSSWARSLSDFTARYIKIFSILCLLQNLSHALLRCSTRPACFHAKISTQAGYPTSTSCPHLSTDSASISAVSSAIFSSLVFLRFWPSHS